MTLEVLFAQQGQAETFLRMVLLGAAFALALTLGGAWRHRHGLSDAADVLCALMLTLAALLVLIHSGEGLRLYALLGLLLGAVLWDCTHVDLWLANLESILREWQKENPA